MSIEDKLKNAETVDIFSDLTEEEKRKITKHAKAVADFYKALYDKTISLVESFEAIRDEFLKHEELYDAFVVSVESAVTEYYGDGEMKRAEARKLSEAIVKRIIGED